MIKIGTLPSNIEITSDGVVIKKYVKYARYQNELMWLNKMQDFAHTPRIISYSNNTISMTFEGDKISLNNIPNNWKSQCRDIIKGLYHYDCSHNDINSGNLLVNDQGMIILIDFEWSTRIDENIDDPPLYLGGKYAFSDNDYVDEYSLYYVIKEVIETKIPLSSN